MPARTSGQAEGSHGPIQVVAWRSASRASSRRAGSSAWMAAAAGGLGSRHLVARPDRSGRLNLAGFDLRGKGHAMGGRRAVACRDELNRSTTGRKVVHPTVIGAGARDVTLGSSRRVQREPSETGTQPLRVAAKAVRQLGENMDIVTLGFAVNKGTSGRSSCRVMTDVSACAPGSHVRRVHARTLAARALPDLGGLRGRPSRRGRGRCRRSVAVSRSGRARRCGASVRAAVRARTSAHDAGGGGALLKDAGRFSDLGVDSSNTSQAAGGDDLENLPGPAKPSQACRFSLRVSRRPRSQGVSWGHTCWRNSSSDGDAGGSRTCAFESRWLSQSARQM